MSDTVSCAFSYCRLILLVCATEISFSSQTRFNSPSRSSFSLNISIFSGYLLSRIVMFSYITDLSFWIFSSNSLFLILVLSSAAIAFISPFRCCTLETKNFFSEDMVFDSTLKPSTLILISFNYSVRQAIYFFCWLFSALRISEHT